MPIKFQCPNCKRALTVKDEMAGKKGPCPDCKTIVTVPAASTPPAPPADGAAPPVSPSAGQAAVNRKPVARPAPGAGRAKPQPKPPVPAAQPEPAPPAEEPPEDVEAAAAALLADEPAQQQAQEPATIDFTCPFCDESIQLPLELAGKKSPCPSCKRIIKVPEPQRTGPRDWREAEKALPLGARRDQVEPEGAWGSKNIGRVGAEALVQAGVIQKPKPPRTTWQKIRLPVAGVTVLVVGIVATFLFLSWRQGNREQKALQTALSYASAAGTPKEVGAAGQAALYMGAGEYYLHQQKPGCASKAREQMGQSLQILRGSSGNERELVLIQLALLQMEMGGTPEEARQDLRTSWPDTLKHVRGTLEAIEAAPARLEAIHHMIPRLLALGQGDRVLQLVNQLYSTKDANRAEGLATAGLVLLQNDQKAQAERALEQALELYKGKKPVALRSAVVALAMALKKDPPKARKEPGEAEERHIGEAGGLARQGQWDQARELARSDKYGAKVRLRALLAAASAAVDTKAGEGDVETAVEMAQKEMAAVQQNEADGGERDRIAWELLRLVHVGVRAGMDAERLSGAARAIADPGMRGWAQMELVRPRLAPGGLGADEAVLEPIEHRALGYRLARLYLARFHTRRDAGWARNVEGWEEPVRAFGSLGVALGLQDRGRGG